MKLSRTASYAVHAILAISQDESGRPVACREIAQDRALPRRFLLQILRNLVTHGLLVSVRGVDGGYKLNRPAEEITLLSLIEAIEGPLSGNVPTGGALSESIQEKLRLICDDVAAVTRIRLGGVKLKDLMSGETPAKQAMPPVAPIAPPLLEHDLNGTFSNSRL